MGRNIFWYDVVSLLIVLWACGYGHLVAAASPEAPHATVPSMPTVKEPLKFTDSVKAVPHKMLLKRHRLELSPAVGLSMNDPYFEHSVLSGVAIFYPHDAFGIGVGVDSFLAHAKTNQLDVIRLNLIAGLGTFNFPELFAHTDLYFVPLYGKISVFNRWIVTFDMYTAAGVGFATSLNQHASFLGNVALGQHYGLLEWLALRIELRDYFFVDNQQANSLPQSRLQNYVMFFAGLSFFVPPTFEYTAQ